MFGQYVWQFNCSPSGRGGTWMDVKVCKRCGGLFQYLSGRQVCPRCKKKEEEIFQQVKEYLRENPNSSMEQTAEETGASVSLIQSFLREGRLQVSPDSPIALTCESCGERILTGRYCDKCRSNMTNTLNQAAKSLKPAEPEKQAPKHERERMRFLDGHK